ncbi:unnamed protein product, partial [Tilletia controversa]
MGHATAMHAYVGAGALHMQQPYLVYPAYAGTAHPTPHFGGQHTPPSLAHRIGEGYAALSSAPSPWQGAHNGGSTKWIIDSGASSHMTPHNELFSDIRPDSTSVMTADGKRLRAQGRGNVTLVITNPKWDEITLYDVLHVPGLECNLVSVHQLNKDHLKVEFTLKLEARVTDPFNKDFVIIGSWSAASQAYLLPTVGCLENANVSAFAASCSDVRSAASEAGELAPPPSNAQVFRLWSLWHPRLGHLGNAALPLLAQNSVGLPALLYKRNASRQLLCETCSLTKIKKSPFPTSTTKTHRALELVHADLTGRIIAKSLGGAEYIAVLVDDFTRMMWVLPLVRKSDFVEKFIEWRNEVVPYKGQLACLRTDGGGEFNNAALHAALGGARHERSCAYTAQQNGVAERYVGILKSVMRPILHGRQLPLEFWAEAAMTATYIRNRCPSSANGGKTPFELWHGTPPNLSDLRVFGCLAFAMLSDKQREHSLAFRSRPGVFIGYDMGQKGYRIYFPDTRVVVVTRNVEFHEEKGYDFSYFSPQDSSEGPPLAVDLTVNPAPRPPGLRPRLVVIGPRPPAPPADSIVELEELAPGAAPASAAAPAPAPAPVAAPAPAPPLSPAP